MLRLLNRYRSRARRRRRCRRSSKPRRAPPSASCSRTPRRSSCRAPRLDGRHAGVRRRRPQPDRPQVSDRLSVAARLAARDGDATAAGRVVFESGAIDARRRDCAATTATRTRGPSSRTTRRSRSRDQVQIYEPILGDRGGVPTTGLLTATQYLKDNRLLPRGFDKATADPQIGVYGRPRRRGFRRRRRSRALPRRRAGRGPVPRRGRAALSVDRLPLGANLAATMRPSPAGSCRITEPRPPSPRLSSRPRRFRAESWRRARGRATGLVLASGIVRA